MMTLDERIQNIIKECLSANSTNPMEIFVQVASKEFISIHGPEHHILDGACILTAFKNAGGNIELEESLKKISVEGHKMPGAICGLWGVCGSVTSIGAALAIIDGTGPLTEDSSWGKHMEFTSKALEGLGKIGGPRCCKRNAMVSIMAAVEHINENYNVELEMGKFVCGFSKLNKQCIQERCPFWQG